MNRTLARWAAPAAAVATIAGGITAVSVYQASAKPALPPRTAAQLLTDVQHAHVDALSGTIVESADLGLPALPSSMSGANGQGLAELLSGSHTLRIWTAGSGRMRLSLQDAMGESDVIRNGSNLWTWNSANKSATHRVLREDSRTPTPASPLPGTGTTPSDAARSLLSRLSPSTTISTDGTGLVAGRSAYQLQLRPKSAGTLIGSVDISIDSATKVPLKVAVYARGASSPSFEVGFTSFDQGTPPASVFAFNPPPGTKVKQESSTSPLPSSRELHSGRMSKHQLRQAASAAQQAVRTVGRDWATVTVVRMGSMTPAGPAAKGSGSGGADQLHSYLLRLPSQPCGTDTCHVFSGPIFSAAYAEGSGTVAFGAVPASALLSALGTR